jgi:glycosyltransferase involved in cell wall biosynthesis
MDGKRDPGLTSMTPRVSICVPVCNGEPFLRECLDSVIRQTYRNCEVLIVDDASTDDSVGLAEEYSKQDRRFRVLRNDTRLGLAQNWNKCLTLARGEWIKFLFQDDWLHPECLERMIAAEDENAPLIACNRDFVFDDPDDPGNDYYRNTVKHLCSFHEKRTVVPNSEFSRLIMRFLTDNSVCINFVGEPSNMLIRRELMYDLGMFNPNLVQWCDYEYWSRLGSNHGIILVPEVLAKFRIHRGSTTAGNSRERAFMTSLDLPAVFQDFLFAPVYRRFRDAIGEEGRRRLRQYAVNLLKNAQARAAAACNGEEKLAWLEFMEKYPAYRDDLEEPNLKHVARTVRRYLRTRIGQ